MIYEYRHYHAAPGKLPALQARFADHFIRLLGRHGGEIVGVWQPVVGSLIDQLHYLVKWDSMASLEDGWAALRADPEWQRVRAESEQDGPLVSEASSELWRPAECFAR